MTERFETISPDVVARIALAALCKVGVKDDAARIQVEALLSAELKGHASHGLQRLPRLIERISNGVANPNATGEHRWTGDAFLDVDGQRGLGPVVATRAIQRLSDRVEKTGIAIAAIHNSNHIGMLAYYAEAMAKDGLVSIVLSTSEALVHPFGGRRAMVGTNPIAIGVPSEGRPLVMDMATSKVSMGKIHHYADIGLALPDGWALDGDGTPTNDASAAKDGAIAPFGGPKGYALGLAFEVLVVALTDSALGTDVVGTLDSTMVCNKGDLIFAMRPRSDGTSAAIGRYLDAVRATAPIEPGDSVSVPGDRGAQREREISEAGITLPAQLAAKLRELSGIRPKFQNGKRQV